MNDEQTVSEARARARARTEAKNQAARETLEPLAPGERPLAVTIAAVVAMGLAVANLVAFVLSDDKSGPESGRFILQTLLICAVLVAASIGMWKAKYWAVLGFQTILGLQVIVFCLAMTRVESALTALLELAIIVASSILFWFLIRAMARIQMPESPEVKKLREAEDPEVGADD